MKNLLLPLLLCAVSSSAFALSAAAPSFSPASGVYDGAQSVAITSATSGASIAYTTDGSIPTESGGTVTNGTLYTDAVSIKTTTTFSAIAFASGYLDSAVVIEGYTLQVPPARLSTPSVIIPAVITQVAAPVFNPSAGTFNTTELVAITTTTGGATIRYTTDGSAPTETNGTIYSGEVYIFGTTTLNAIAYETGFTDSAVTSGLFTMNLPGIPGLNVLYSFPTSSIGGGSPYSGLLLGSDGNFYGSTLFSGSLNSGTVFKTTPSGVVTTLVSFIYSNGELPQGDMIQGTDGNFYGTTSEGGSGSGLGNGTIFRMTPAGVLTTLVAFNGTNGQYPLAGLVEGRDGNFYGTTRFGGSANDGTVFQMTSSGTLTSLISFTGANGQYPECQLVEGIDGNFYGTTKSGGSANDGTVFSISPLGAFNSLASFSGTNGANPTSGLVLGTDGNFYGTTSAGGGVFNDGTIFKVTSAGTLTSLVSFTGLNGAQPLAVLVQGTDGNFYGTTNSGSSLGDGSVFRVTPAGVLTTLAAFNGANGDQPDGRVIQGSDGNLYGTTEFGGTSDAGVIFQLIKPSQVAAPSFSLAAGTFTSAQTVAMTTATSGALIVYTANGTTPAESGGFITNGKLYSTPVTISATTTINAIAFESGMDSPITTVTYTIGTPVTATPAPPASGGGGGGAPSYWFLAFLAAAGLLRWRFRQAQAI